MPTTIQWLAIKIETRNKLREILGIQKTGTSWVRDNQVVSDGTTQEDLNAIDGEKLADFVGSGGTIEELFLKAIESIEHNVIMTPTNEVLPSNTDAPLPTGLEVAPQTPQIAPETTKEPEKVVKPIKEFKCEVCGKICKNALGLSGHSRSHKPKKVK